MSNIEQANIIRFMLVGDREPDQVITDDVDGVELPYLRRWWIKDKSREGGNVYLHNFKRSDYDRALHDHPRDSASIILCGSYIEHMPGGVTALRKTGDIITRKADQLHRVELIPGEDVWTLFIIGPKVREWGFACPGGWVHWMEFVDGKCGD